MNYAPFPLIWGGVATAASFTTIQTDYGTYPTASGTTDTLTFTSLDGSVFITGTALTDTISFRTNLAGESLNQAIVIALMFG